MLAAAAIATVAGNLPRDWNRLRDVGEMLGTTVSVTFLLLIVFAILCVLLSVRRRFRATSCEHGPREQPSETLLAGGGLLARVRGPTLGTVRRNWHVHPVGVLFSLGFDTATELGVLFIAATHSAAGVRVLHILVFPALFTAAMSFTDNCGRRADAQRLFVGVHRSAAAVLTITASSVADRRKAPNARRNLADHCDAQRQHGANRLLVVGLFVLVRRGSVVSYQRVAASPAETVSRASGQLTLAAPRTAG